MQERRHGKQCFGRLGDVGEIHWVASTAGEVNPCGQGYNGIDHERDVDNAAPRQGRALKPLEGANEDDVTNNVQDEEGSEKAIWESCRDVRVDERIYDGEYDNRDR